MTINDVIEELSNEITIEEYDSNEICTNLKVSTLKSALIFLRRYRILTTSIMSCENKALLERDSISKSARLSLIKFLKEEMENADFIIRSR